MSLEWPSKGAGPTCGVIGWPVTYSLSPAIHNAAFAELGMDWTYVHLPVPEGRMPEAAQRLGSEGWAGANVTIPHKTAAAEVADWLSEDAAALNAVNTLAPLEGGGLAGHNTDAPGFARFLSEDADWEPEGRSALIYGAGGAARACALSLARGGIDRLAVAVRDPGRATALVRLAEEAGARAEAIPFERAAYELADLVVNSTPLGREGEELPLPPLGISTVVVDLLYVPPTTPMLATAAEAGARTFGGLGLLVHQAALSFELWTGRSPSVNTMREAALRALS